MDRNRLKGMAGDLLNAILSAAGMNFKKLLKLLKVLLFPFPLITLVRPTENTAWPIKNTAFSELTI